jgi:hypothetical protein
MEENLLLQYYRELLYIVSKTLDILLGGRTVLGTAESHGDLPGRMSLLSTVVKELRLTTSAREKTVTELEQELERKRKWIEDLQNKGFVNCVYCGCRFGPAETTAPVLSDVLKRHMEECSKHPMSDLKKRLDCSEKGVQELASRNVALDCANRKLALALEIAAGMLSASPGYIDKHPGDVLDTIMAATDEELQWRDSGW